MSMSMIGVHSDSSPPRPRSLFELTAEMQAVIAAVEDGGEIDEALAAWIATLETDASHKIDGGIACVLRLQSLAAARKATAEIYQAEADEFAKAAKSLENGANRIKEAIYQHLKATGQKSLKTPSGRKVRIQVNGTAPVLYDDQMPDPRTLPEDITKCEVNRAAVREHLLSGKLYSWARLGPVGDHLRIEVSKYDRRGA